MVLWGALLLVIFLTGSYAIVRFSRRFRAYLLRPRNLPTADEDVWKMHRVPDTLNEEDEQ